MSRKLLATHLPWPTLAFLMAAGALGILDADPLIASSWAYHPLTGWLVASGAPWTNFWLHDVARSVMVATAVLAGAGWVLRFILPSHPYSHWSSELGRIAVTMGITALVIGGLKQITDVACPVDLSAFGGDQPYLGVFRPRPLNLPHVVCFPGAHAGSGFSLFAFYFALRDRKPVMARWCLGVALLTGTAFAFIQEARGAHFLSHDLWSGFLAWVIALGVYLLRPEPVTSLAGGVAGRTTERLRDDGVGHVGT